MAAGALAPTVLSTDRRRADPLTRLRYRQTFRMAFGMVVSSALAFGVGWTLSFFTPVLTAALLTTPRALPPKAQVVAVGLIGFSLVVGSELLLPLLQYTAVYILVTGLLIFVLFYFRAMGLSPIVVALLLLGVVAIPLIGTILPGLGKKAAQGILFATVVAMTLVHLSIAVIPDPRDLDPPAPPPKPERPTREQAAFSALRGLTVFLPMVIVFQMYSLVEATVGLFQAMLLTMDPAYGKHLRMGSMILVSHGAGGVAAVVVFGLLTMVPSFWFLLLLMLAAGLVMGDQIFRGTTLGKLLKSGTASFFIVLGPSLVQDGTASSNLTVRLVSIAVAVLYVVLAFALMERLRGGRRRAA